MLRWLCKKSLFKTFLGLVLNYSIPPQLNLIEGHPSQQIKLSATGFESINYPFSASFFFFFLLPLELSEIFSQSWNDSFKEDVINKFNT